MSIEETVKRQKLAEELRALSIVRKNWIRKMVTEYRRLDVLAEEVFDLNLQPFHIAMQSYGLKHQQSLQLAFRGSGKTTTVTEMRAIGEMLWNQNTRLLLCARTGELAKDMLGEIKQFIQLDDFIDIFGDLRGDETWDKSKIVIGTRDMPRKEPTISTVGTEGQVVGKHFDGILCDDLIDENNARTKHMREQVETFFYKTLTPTLEPHGFLSMVGTRYHPADIYGHLIENDMADTHRIIQALDDKMRSPWPTKYPPSFFFDLKKKMGSVLFDTQYQCSTDKMRGGIFQYDWIQELSDAEVDARFPARHCQTYIGVDPSVGEKAHNDPFAMVCIRVNKEREILVWDFYEGRLTMSNQMRKISQWYHEYGAIQAGIESNAYQSVLAQQMSENYADVQVKRIFTKTDKVSRGQRLSPRFEGGKVFFRKGQELMIDHLLLFPRGRYDDLFDALYFAVSCAFRRRRRRGREDGKEVGLI